MQDKRLLTDEHAAMIREDSIGKKYRPSNGTEGDMFMAMWCEHCIHDKPDDPCEIIASTMCFSVDDPEYPEEWQYDTDGQPICTEFCP